MAPNERLFNSVRDYFVLGQFIGKKLVDITENDPEEEERYVMFQFEDGSAIKVTKTDDGFHCLNVDCPDDDED